MKRELLIIRSESMFVFEIVGELGIPVLLLVLYGFMGILDELAAVASQLIETGVFLQLVYLLLLLFANLSMISSTSVSRQGKRFDLDKQYPLEASTFVRAKLLFHLLLVFIPHAIYLAAAFLLLSLPLWHLLWMIPLSLLCIGMIACLQLAIDYHHPRLDWKVSQQAMKSNLNGLFGMLAAFMSLALFALILLLPMLIGLSMVLSVLLLFGLTGLGFSLSYRLALRGARVLLSK
jgi:ABC-2 type transport system permease protein